MASKTKLTDAQAALLGKLSNGESRMAGRDIASARVLARDGFVTLEPTVTATGPATFVQITPTGRAALDLRARGLL